MHLDTQRHQSASPLGDYHAVRHKRLAFSLVPPPLFSLPPSPVCRPPPPPPHVPVLGPSCGHVGLILGHLGLLLAYLGLSSPSSGHLGANLHVTWTSMTPRWLQDGPKMTPGRLQHGHVETRKWCSRRGAVHILLNRPVICFSFPCFVFPLLS